MSLLQEYVKKHGTDGLNKKYVDQALANGGGNGATAAGIYSPSLVDNNFITSFLSETRRYMQDAESDFGSVGYKNASSLYSSHFDRLNDLKKRRDAISMYLKGNKDKFDEEFYNTFTADLDLYGSAFEEYQSAFKSASDFYSQFDTEQDYNDYVAAEEDRKQKLSFDLSAGKKELDDLYAQRDEARQIQNRINGLEWQVNEGDGSEATQMALEKLRAQLKQYGDLDSTITQKEQYYNEAKRLQSGEKLKADAVNAADFEEFAKKGADIKNPTMAEAERGFQVFGWKPFAEQVGNEVTYSRENYEELGLAEMMGTVGMEGKSLYHYMTDEEVKIYNYYLAKEGKDKADEYLYSIEESLNARQGGVLADSAAGNLALQYLLGAAAGLDQFASGVKSIFSDEDYINTSAMQFASGMVREDLSETGPKVLGSSLGQVGYDLINTTANMAPSILASTIISTVATPVAGAAFGTAVGETIGATAGKVVGAGLLGASAGGNAYAEKLNAGYSKDQAAAYGMMVAASEAGLEYLIGGISKMGGKLTGKSIEAIANNIDNAVGRVAAKWGMSMLAEGTEEYLQEVLNPWYENIVFNMNNDVTLLSEEALYSGLLGALSAGVLEGRSTISADRAMTRYGESLKKDGLSVERLKSLGQTFAADTVAYELAGKVDENTGAYTIARLFNEVNAQLSEQNKADIVKSLERKGYATKHAEIIANQLAAAVDGAEFGALQRYVLDHNEDIAKTFADVILNPNSTVNQRRVQSATSLFELAKEVDKARVLAKYAPTSPVMKSAEQYDADAKTAATNSSAALASPTRTRSIIEFNFDEGIPASPEALARSIAESRRVSPVEQMAAGLAAAEKKAMGGLTVSKSGKVEHKPTGKEIGKLTIVSDKDKKLKLKTESGEIVDAKDVNFRSKDEAMVYSAVLGMGVNPVVAQSIVDNFDGTDGMVYAADVKLAYQYGKMNFPKSLLEKLEIKPYQAEHAYKLGRSDAKVAKSKTGRSTQYKRGSLVYEYDVDESTLTPMQKVGIDGLKMLADLSSVRFHIFESTLTEDGYRFTKPDGTVTGANGWYLEGTNDIWVDINSGNFGQGLMMHTVAHEISHYIKEWSPAKWQAMADFLLEQYGEKGVPVHILLERQMQKLKRRNPSLKGNALMDAAYEELVSDAMSEMLVDGRVAEKMQALKKKDAALWEKIKDAIKDLLDRWGIIRKEYKGVTPEAAEAQFLHDMDKAFSKLQDMFAEAFADADANFSVAGLTVDNSINMESDVIDSANVGILGKPRSAKMQERTEYLDAPKQAFSVSTTNGKTDAKMVTADDIRKEGWFTGTEMSVKALRDARFKQNGFTKKQIDAMNGFIKDAADAMAKARLKYRFIGLDDVYNAQIVISPVNGSITISAMVKNGDYAVNFDFTKICKKRVALQQVIEELAMDKGRLNEDGTTTEVDLSSANIKRINDILASYGVETACLCCFVESKRYNMQSLYQEKVIDVWNRLVAEFDQNAPYFDGAETPVDISKVPDSEFDALLEQVEKWKKRKGPEGEVVEEKMRAFLENTPAARKKLRFSDLVTATGRTNLHKLYPQVESLVLQKLGTAAPKSVEAFTPYNGEIDLLEAKSGKDLVKYIASIAGVRSQSFSDFMIAHVFDVLQKTASLSARKLPAHTYTKEIARALLFGMTGEKHNMSVLHNIDPNVDSWQAGLSEDGQYLFSDYKAYRDGYSQFIQSIGWEDAVALQNTEGYSKDCGVIAVGFSYLHMKKIHADPDVRQVIGYHTSDMPVEVKPMTHLDKSTDYTPVQNTLNFGGFAVPQYDIPDGVPSYATPPQDVMVGRKGPKTKKSSVQFDIKARFAELSAGKTGAARTAAAKQTLRELLQLAEENGLVLKTTKAKAGHGDFNLYEDLEKTGDPYVTTDHYIEYCIENGWLPMFYEFALDQNYYKDNFDFNVFDRLSYNPETGLHEDTADRKAYAPQTAVHMLNEDGTLSFPEDFFEIVDKQMQGYDQYQQYVAQKMPDIMRDIRSIKDDSGKPMISKESARDEEAAKYGVGKESGKVKISEQDNPYHGKSLYRNAEVYDYDFMVSLQPMEVHTMPSLAAVKTGDRVDQKKAVSLGLKNAEEVGRVAENGSYAITNVYTGREIHLGQHGLEHSLGGNDVARLRTNARLSAIGGLIVQNAVPINGLTNKNRQANGTYALACLLKSGNRYVVAIVTVEEHSSTAVDIDYVDISHSISGRLVKNKEDSRSSTRETGYVLSEAPATTAFKVSISDFLEIVNETYRSILSADVLKHFGAERPADGYYSDRVLYSDRDSDGHQLSKEQQEYFKDSKVRDADGRLKVVYHGSTAVFTEFDLSFMGRHGSAEGQGIYFTDSKTMAEGYQNADGQLMEGYLLISKPLSDSKLTLTRGEVRKLLAALDPTGDDIVINFDPSGVGYPSRAWYNRAMNAALDMLMDGNDTDTELMGEIANINGDTAPVLRMAREVLGYDGYIVEGKYEDATVYVAFESNQFKDEENENPTTDPDIRYSERDIDSVSNRDILANAFMDVAQDDVERGKIAEYQQKIKALDEDERKLRDIRAQLHDLSFSAGPRDNAKIRELREKATKLANRIGIQDKQLLRLEASKPLMSVLEREKKLAYSRASQKWEDRIETARTGRSKTEMRHKIKKIVGELNNLLLHGTKDKHIMIGLQKATAEALSAINMDTVAAEKRLAKIQAKIDKATDPAEKARLQQSYARVEAMGDNMSTRLTALKNAYEEIKDSGDPLVANAYQPEIEERIKNLRKMVGDTPLRNMSMEQLEFTYDTYKMVLTTIRNANKAFKNERGESIAVLGNRSMEEIGRVGGKKELVASAMRGPLGFAWSGMKPTYAFKAIGSDTLSELFSQVRAGEDVWATDVNDAKEFYSQKTKQYNYDSWDMEKEYTFTSKSGKEFKLTLEQIMSLYAYSKRKQADAHLDKGGFVFDSSIEVVKRSKLGIPVKYRVNTAHAHALSRDTLMEICKTLTDEQVKFVDEMQDYLSTVMGEKGNEVSLKMYGVKLFKEKFYFPLKSAKQFMYEQYEVAGDRKIKNSGFSKDTTPHASNPVILNNFTDVWATHVNDMAMYHAFVLPMEDFERVFNYKTPTSDTMPTESVKGYLQDAYGVHPEQYIKQLMTDLNGGARIDPTAGIINKGIALFKKSAVFASLSVVIQQPSAIARAMAYIDAKYFVGKPGLKDWDEVKKYAPVAIIKEMGYFDTNMGKSTVEFIKAKEYTGVKSKMKALVTDRQYRDEILSKAPSVADELAWCQIWNAVKKEIAETKKLQGEELLQAAGKRFTEVIVNTQVYDSVLTRSGMMRSKDTGMKMATSFMAEPTTSLNMIADALIQGKRGNKGYSRKTIGAVAASMILNSILVSFVYAGRDDDEDKTYIEKYVGSLTSELIDSFNPLTLIPFVKDIVSIAQGYDVERSDMAVITDLFNAWKKLSSDNLSVYRKVEGFGGTIASIFGLPLKNIMRDVRGIYNTVKSAVAGPDTTGRGVLDAARESLPKWMGGGERSNADQLYAAMLSGDTGHVERLKARFKDDRAFTYAVRDGLVNNDKRITAAAEARAAGNQTEYMRLAREIVNEGHFSQDDVVRAVNYVLNSLTKKESEPAEATKPETFNIDEYLSEALSGDQAEAELVKREIIAGHVADGKTEDEALKSFNNSFKNTAVKGAFTDGDITMDVAIAMLQQYGGVEPDDAYADVQYWQFKQNHPDIYVVDSWFDSYYEYASDAGIGIDVYMQYRNDVKNITGENKKERRMAAINALPLSPAQKDALYFDEGWVASKLYEAPWR